MLKKLFPFLNWFPISGLMLRADLLAGLTVSLVLIPQSMAYADLAGLPPLVGLYAGFLPVIIGALWGSSRHVSTGPVATSSLLTATVLLGMRDYVSVDIVTAASMLAVLVGLSRLVIGFFKLTFVANFISRPVLDGFTHACVLVIAASQLGKIVGIDMVKSHFYLHDLWVLATQLGQLNWISLAVGLISWAMLIGFRKFVPKIPGALLVVIIMTSAVYFLGLNEGPHALNVIGPVQSGLPKFVYALPDWSTACHMLSGAAAMLLISFMEMCSVSKTIAAQSKQRLNLNQEMIGQGLASLASGFSGSYTTSTSFSRSALNFGAGAKTGLSSVFCGLIMLVFLIFFSKYLYYLPIPALAAIIIESILRLLKFERFARFWNASRLDGAAAGITFFATLLFAPAVQNGIFVGMIVSLCFYLYETMRPRISIVGEHEDGTLRVLGRTETDRLDVMPIVRIDSHIYFANSSWVENAILKVESAHPNAEFIALACEGMNGIDASGVEMLRDVNEHLRGANVRLIFVGLKEQVLDVFARTEFDTEIGPENRYPTIQRARAALQKV